MTTTSHPRLSKDRSIQFRVDETQLEALELAARQAGATLANWCRRNLLKLANWQLSEKPRQT